MPQAEDLFNETYYRCLDRWSVILSFRLVAEAGLPTATEIVSALNAYWVQQLISNSEYERIIRDKKAFVESGAAARMVEISTAKSVENAQASVDAASVVFAHSVLDGAALDFCRVTALVAPQNWEPALKDKKVSLLDFRGSSYDQVMWALLDQYFEQLAKESLLKKVDLLYQRCQPPANWSPMHGYRFDRDRLEMLDQLRHEIIHGEGLGRALPSAAHDVEYLMKTALLLMGLVNFRYGLKLDPYYPLKKASRRQAFAG